MEKLPLLVHGKPITDQGGEDNLGAEHRLRGLDAAWIFFAKSADVRFPGPRSSSNDVAFAPASL